MMKCWRGWRSWLCKKFRGKQANLAREPEAARRAICGNLFTLGIPDLCASHRSRCTCTFSQKSGDVPSAPDRRKDIGAVMFARPFRIRDRWALVTPNRSAAYRTSIPPRYPAELLRDVLD